MNPPQETKNIKEWLTAPLEQELSNAIKRISRSEGVRHVTVMPDVHLSGEVCIGTVVATDSKIYPQAVGNDIGCGMATIGFECKVHDLFTDTNAAKIFENLYRLIPSNRHSRLTVKQELPARLQNQALSDSKLESSKTRDGRVQFGTLGRGNHFLEFQADEDDMLWVTVHSGSRSMGQQIVNHHLSQSKKIKPGLSFFEANSSAGKAYLNDHRWASTYAEANRIEIIERVKEILKQLFNITAFESTFFSCDHNHVRQERHFGENLLVHRKGSLSAHQNELGIIPGSMGSPTFHTRGRGCKEALCSSSHGAGRLMSRGKARKKITINALYSQMKGVWFDHRISHKLVDEAPSAYKDIQSVMRAQKDLTRIIRKLKPILNYKGA